MVKSQILLNSQFLFNFVDILFNRIFFHCCLHFPHDLSHVYTTNSLFFLISTKFSAPSLHAHSLITCLLPLLEPLLMLMHLPTWDVLLPLIYYLCPTLLFGALRLKFHLLFDFFFFTAPVRTYFFSEIFLSSELVPHSLVHHYSLVLSLAGLIEDASVLRES